MVNILGANSVSGGYEIDNSIRFNDGDSPKLAITPSGAGDRDTFTFSFWIKRTTLGASQRIFSAGTSIGTNNNNVSSLLFESNDTLKFFGEVGGSASFALQTNRLFRDPSAWYHIVVAIDTEDGTAANRIKLYVNGVQETSFSTATYMSQNTDTFFNATNVHNISYTGGGFVDGYLAEFHHIDGTQVAPTDFGEFDDNGVWIPKAYTGSYGTNGFYLQFKETGTGTDASGIGADTSGNDNHFAVTNLAALDVMPDTPTNNWCTYNPLDLGQSSSGATFSQGNLSVSTTTAFEDQVGSTFGVSSGKWYWETKIQSNQNRESIGAILVGTGLTGGAARVQYYSRNGAITLLNSSIATGATYGDNDVISVTLDLDNNVAKFFKNNALQGTVNSLTAGTWVPAYFDGSNGVGALAVAANFGQDGTFAGLETAGNNADANGFGNFKYAVPSGFYSLCTKNLAEFG